MHTRLAGVVVVAFVAFVAFVVIGCGGGDAPAPEEHAAEPVEPVEPAEPVEPDEESPDEEPLDGEPLDEQPPGGEEGTEEDGEVEQAPPGDDEGSAREDEDEEPTARRSPIGWLLGLGPSAPAGPSEFRAYQHLLDLDCVGLMERLDDGGHEQALHLQAESEALYRAVGSACLAAFEGRSELWAAARELAALAGAGSGSCLDQATRQLLDDLLDAHADDPAAVFEPALGAEDAQAPPCPRIDRLAPDRGPPGTEIRIEGANLGEVAEVEMVYGTPDRWDARSLEVVASSDREMRVLLGAEADAHRSVCLALFTSQPDWYADGALFEVELASRAETDEAATEEGDDAPADASAADRPATTVACPPQL